MTQYQATFLNIQDAVIAKARLDSTNDLAKVKAWINQAYYTACIESNFYESSSAAAALSANASSVAVPSSVVKVEWIAPAGSDGSAWATMEEVTMEQLLDMRAWQGGISPLGSPSKYAFRSASAPSIEFYPTASGGEVLTFYGLLLPAMLSADGDFPIFPEPYASKVLEYGALVQATEFKKDLFFLQTYQQEWQDWLRRLKAFNNQRSGAKPMKMQVERQLPWPRGNSVDLGV